MAGPIRIAVLANASQATKELRGVAGTADSMGSKVASAAKKAALGLAVLGAGAAIKFTKDAAVLDTKMREVVTLFGETGKAAERSLGVVRGQVRSLSDEFGIAQETLTGGLYQAISAGVPRDNALEFMRVASKAAIGGVTDVETAVDGLSSTINAYGLDAKDASKVADSMFTAVKGGKTTFEELSSSLFNVAPAAAASKVSFQEVNAAIATLTAGGTPTAVATTQIRAALTGLQRPSADLTKIFQALGYENAQVAIESKGLGFALDAVKDASKGNNGELQKLLGSSEAVAAANVLAGDGAKKFTAELKNQKKAAGAAADAFDTVNKGAERQFEILKTNLRNVGLSVGQALLPALAKVSSYLASEVGPAVDRVTQYLSENKDEFRATAQTVADTVLPPLKTLGEIVVGVTGFLAELPAPVKEIGIQAGIAALILPRLTAGVTGVTASMSLGIARARQYSAEMTYTATRTQAATAMMGRLSTAARGAAGIGGLLALSAGASTANQSLSFLAKAGGGAMLGFSLGGPVGAAIGAGAGALYGLASATSTSAVEMVTAKDNTKAYADTLDQLTGAITATTRARVKERLLADSATAANAQDAVKYGASMRDIISATLGQEGALRRLRTAQRDANEEFRRLQDIHGFGSEEAEGARQLTSALLLLLPQLGAERRILKENAEAARQHALDTQKLSKVYAGVPPRVITKIRAEGGEVSIGLAKRLIRQFQLTPKQVQTIFRANNIEKTDAQVRGLIKRVLETEPASRRANAGLSKVGDAKPSNKWVQLFQQDANRGERQSREASQAVQRFLKQAGEQRPNMQPFLGGLTAGITTSKARAAAGGREIGGALKSGLEGGFSGAISSLSTMARNAVAGAIAAGRRAAKAQSPSRETMKLGKDLGDGLTIGLARTRAQQKKAGQDLVAALLSGVGGSDQVGKALDKIRSLVERTVKHKKDKVESAREREILKHLKDRFAELTKIGRAQDKAKSDLREQRDLYRGLVQGAREYAAGIRDAVVESGNLTTLGKDEEGNVSLGGILSDLKDKVARAVRYSGVLKQLADAKLSGTALQQLIDAGPEGGLATAAAIAAGGKAAVDEVNTLTGQLVTTGQGLGTAMSAEFHTAGINAAAALVRGLEKDSAALDRAAKRLARRLAAAVRSELGIKSPSRVFMKIGDEVMKGLEIALDETRAASLGTGTAKSLVQGFGTPSLDSFNAVAGAASASTGSTTVKIYVTAPVGSSKAEIGAEVKSTLDAYYNSGGRDLAIGG